MLKNCIFQVVENHLTPILGTPELEENEIIIDTKNRQISQRNVAAEIFTAQGGKNGNIKIIEKKSFFTTQAKTNGKISLPPKQTSIIELQLDSTPSNHIYALPEKITKNKNLEIYPQCIKVNKLDACIKIQIGNNSAIPVNFDKNAIICRIAEVSIGVPETGKLEKVMEELKIGDAPKRIRENLKTIIGEYVDVFAVENEKLGKTDAMSYSINTGDAAPVASQRYKTPYYLRNELKKIIDSNLKSGLLEPISSPWAAPVLLVKKPNGKWRLVCDYRKLNGVTIANQYPLPEIEGLIDTMAESAIFSTADLFTGFHQIPCDEDTKAKVAITTDFGQFTWTGMPMGGKNAPAVFQQLMDKVFSPIPKSQIAIYLDDICMHSRTYDENLQIIKQALEILRQNNLKIRAAKTEFLMKKVKFCGALISEGKRQPNPEKTFAVRNLVKPASKKEASSIYGLLNYFRNFIPNFAAKASPIADAMGKTFRWTKNADDALDKLKTEIGDFVESLKIPNPNKGHFAIETDASENGAGSVLLYKERENSDFRPVAFFSMRFNDTQRNYNISEKELLAGKKTMEKFSHYLLGRPFLWFTDNSCVNWAHKVKPQKMKIARWLAEIADFDFKTILKPSKEMAISDCLSRHAATIKMVKAAEMRHLQEMDRTLDEVIRFTSINRWPHDPSENLKPFKKWREKLCFGNNSELGIKLPFFRVIPPESTFNQILKEYHDNSGHPGISQTLSEIEKKYFLPSMRVKVKEHIDTCSDCQFKKPSNHPFYAPLGNVVPPQQPFEDFAIDLIGPLALTDDDNRYICVSTDLFSKRVYAQPMQGKTAPEVLKAAIKDWYRNPHLPQKVLMDNGTEFSELRKFCEERGIKVSMSPAYHPQTNGECENRNRTIKSRLRLACDFENWDLHLPKIIHQINSAAHSVTKVSPYQIETGFSGSNNEDKYKIRKDPVFCNFEDIRDKILKDHNKRAEKSTKDADLHKFEVGDLVLIKTVSSLRKAGKYEGPFKIIEIRNQGLSFLLKNENTGNITSRHISHLKLYKTRKNPDVTFNCNFNQSDIQKEKTKRKKKRRPYFFIIEENAIQKEPENQAQQSHDETASENSDNALSSLDDFTPQNMTALRTPENSSISSGCSSDGNDQTESKKKRDFSDSSSESSNSEIETILQNNQNENPKPRKLVSPVLYRISDLHDAGLNEFMKTHKIEQKTLIKRGFGNAKKAKMDRINEWISRKRPDWAQDENGEYLIEFPGLKIDKKMFITELKLIELVVLAKHLNLEIDTDGKGRKDLAEEISTKAIRKYPEKFKRTTAGTLIIDPTNFE